MADAPRRLSRVERWVEDLQSVLGVLQDMDARRRLTELWRELRNTIEEQRARLAAAPGAPPARPATTASVNEMREVLHQTLLAEANEVAEQSKTLETLRNIRPAWARNYILQYMEPSARTNELGCWLSPNAPSSDKGYVKQNLRNTTYYQTGAPPRKLDINPYVHQLAAVAGGQGGLLPLTSLTRSEGERFECSHLCHNHACFNPAHIVVEPRLLNLLRNGCRCAFVLVVGDTIIDPCPHWDDARFYGNGSGRRFRCILRRVVVPQEMAGQWLEITADGALRRRQ